MGTKIKKIALFTTLVGLIVISFYYLYQSSKDKIEEIYGYLKYAAFYDFDAFKDEYQKEYLLENQRYIDVLLYDLKLKINREEEIIAGDIKIKLKALNNISYLALNLYDNMKVDSLLMNNIAADFIHEDNHIKIFSDLVADSTYELGIIYSGSPKRLGLGSFNFDEIDSNGIIYTINEPSYASTWFPCNDTPNDKAKFKLAVENRSDYYSVAIGNLDSVSTYGNSTTYYWSTQYSLPTYLVAFYSAPFEIYSDSLLLRNNTVEIKVYGYGLEKREAVSAIQIMKKSLTVFDSLFGEYSFPDEKISVVEIPWTFGGIENHSAIGIGEKYFSSMGLFNNLFVHEIAHLWWGNSLTPEKWSDIWLNESFASYSEILFDEFLYGKEAAFSGLSKLQFKNYDNSLSNPNEDALTGLTYNNGAWVLHLLKNEVGDSIFFSILKEYYSANKYGNVTTEKFIGICNEKSGRNLDFFFQQYVLQPSVFPRITITLNGNNANNPILSIKQSEIESPLKLRLHLSFLLERSVVFDTALIVSSFEQSSPIQLSVPFDSLTINKDYPLPLEPEIILKGTF